MISSDRALERATGWSWFELVAKDTRVLHLCFGHKWNLSSQTWQVVLVKLTCHPRLRTLFKSLDKWQLAKSTCQVNLRGDTPKFTWTSCLKNIPEGSWGVGVRSRSWPQKGSKSITFYFYCPQNYRWKWCNWRASCVAACYVFKKNWNYFAIFSTTRGQTSIWQCCCVVGGFSAVDSTWGETRLLLLTVWSRLFISMLY